MAEQLNAKDRDKKLKELAAQLGPAFLKELQSQKRYQREHEYKLCGARSPNQEELRTLAVAKRAAMIAARRRIEIVSEMESLLGIQTKLKTPPRDLLQNMDIDKVLDEMDLRPPEPPVEE